MCMVSNVGDQWHDHWKEKPWYPHTNLPSHPSTYPQTSPFESILIPRSEFDALKKEVEQMREELKRAKEHDIKTNQPDCEMEEKMKFIRTVAAAVGINLDDIIKPKTAS